MSEEKKTLDLIEIITRIDRIEKVLFGNLLISECPKCLGNMVYIEQKHRNLPSYKMCTICKYALNL